MKVHRENENVNQKVFVYQCPNFYFTVIIKKEILKAEMLKIIIDFFFVGGDKNFLPRIKITIGKLILCL